MGAPMASELPSLVRVVGSGVATPISAIAEADMGDYMGYAYDGKPISMTTMASYAAPEAVSPVLNK